MGAKVEVAVFAAALAAIFFSAPLIYGLLTTSATIGSVGSVKAAGVKVYRESACVNEMSSIDWGVTEAGSSKNVTVYVKNTGNTAVILSLSTANWNPSGASSYIALSWDYGGQSVNPAGVAQVKLTLRISSSIAGITNFSFDIIVTGTG